MHLSLSYDSFSGNEQSCPFAWYFSYKIPVQNIQEELNRTVNEIDSINNGDQTEAKKSTDDLKTKNQKHHSLLLKVLGFSSLKFLYSHCSQDYLLDNLMYADLLLLYHILPASSEGDWL